MVRRRRKRQRGGTIPIAPIVAGAKMLGKQVLKRKKLILAALGVGKILGKKLLQRRNKRKRARRV